MEISVKTPESHRPPRQRRIDQYRAMLRLCWGEGAVENFPGLLREADDAKRILRRHDRVIWFLRLSQRGALDAGVIVSGAASLTAAQIRRHRRLRRELGAAWPEKPGKNEGYQFFRAWERAEVLAREIPLARNALEGLRLDHFTQVAEAQAQVERFTQHYWKLAVHQRAVEDFIVFPNGWKWVRCFYGESEWEGRFMHHCGNVGCKDKSRRIISLREPVRVGGLTLWKPHLTFTHYSGMIVEMKGRDNTKPDPRYYPYIRRLFLDPWISGLSHKLGSLPERDLAWTDLPAELRAEIEAKRMWIFHRPREHALKEYLNPSPPPPPAPAPTPSAVQRWIDRHPTSTGVAMALLYPAALVGSPFFLLWVAQQCAALFAR